MPKAATGSGGTGTITRRTRIASSTICSAGICATSTARSGSRRRTISSSPTSRTGPATGPLTVPGLTSPVIDGRVTHYGEWSDSVDVRSGVPAGAMQRISDELVRAIRVACDRTTLYLRLEGAELIRRMQAAEVRIVLVVEQPEPARRLELADPIRWAAVDLVEIARPDPGPRRSGRRANSPLDPRRRSGRPDGRTAPVARAVGPRFTGAAPQRRQLDHLTGPPSAFGRKRIRKPSTGRFYWGFAMGLIIHIMLTKIWKVGWVSGRRPLIVRVHRIARLPDAASFVPPLW